MRARTILKGEKRLVSFTEFCCYVSLGASKAQEFARNNGIEVRIGRATRYDLKKADAAIDALSNKQEE